MFDRFNESDLLALIEGELDADAARELESLLRASPEHMARVRAMQADRARVMAMSNPELPMDFIAELEPQLARPMLIETMPGGPGSPGSFRRKHQRADRRRRISRYAIAAALFGGLFAGVWVTTTVLLNRPTRDSIVKRDPVETVAPIVAREDDGDRIAPGQSERDVESSPFENTFVYHRAPLPMSKRGGDEGESAHASMLAGKPVEPRFRTAEFALTLVADDVTTVEQQLGQLVAISLPETPQFATPRMALVRNFSDAEATTLLEQYLPLTLGGNEPAHADVDLTRPVAPSSTIDQIMQRYRRQGDRLNKLKGLQSSDGRNILPSRHLLGRKDLAPSFADQLVLSNRGATHSMTIRATELAAVFDAIESHLQHHGLRTLAQVEADAAAVSSRRRSTREIPLADQVEALRAARALLAEIGQMDEAEVFVVVPVVIEQGQQR